MKSALIWATLPVLLFCIFSSASSGGEAAASGGKTASAAPVVRENDVGKMRFEGEQRFRANCGRCHAAPQKFPPRMTSTVLRHMRVRATITSEDQRLILFYMTQ